MTENDEGEYACAATNDEGPTFSEPLVIKITCKYTATLRQQHVPSDVYNSNCSELFNDFQLTYFHH